MGGADKFLEDLNPDMLRECFFGKRFGNKVVKYDIVSHLKVFPDSQDHLG